MQIYRITNNKTGMFYIGKTYTDVRSDGSDSRKYSHLLDLRAGKHDNQPLQMDWIRHNCSEDDLLFDVLVEDVHVEEAGDIETDLIMEYREKFPGKVYNVITPRKTANKYTTIQMRRDVHTEVRQFCNARGHSISGMTEVLWMNYMSSSMGE